MWTSFCFRTDFGILPSQLESPGSYEFESEELLFDDEPDESELKLESSFFAVS